MKRLLLLLIICSCSQYQTRNPSGEGAVFTLIELKEKIQKAKHGDIITIPADSFFDFSEEPTLTIDKKIHLKGKASTNGEKPVFKSFKKPLPLISIKADGVTIEGLKIEGVETDQKKKEIIELNKQGIKGVYQFPVTRGIHVLANDVKIINCELSGFSHAAIFAENAVNLLVEKNYIHHNQRWGLGYGVSLHLLSTARIINNKFNFNRHSIAGSGSPGQSYGAAYNWFGKNHSASPLDMHGGKDRGDGTHIAGKVISIHHNTIEDNVNYAFIHRGIAQDFVIFENNKLEHSDDSKVIGYYNIKPKDLPKNKFIYRNNKLND
jgi:hypothetical protein